MAVNLTLNQLLAAVETDLTDETLTRLLAVAAATIEKKAAAAPEAVQNEAAIRMIGYLVDQPKSAQRMQSVGDFRTLSAPMLVSAFHWSGAEPLLAPWMVHRAGLITVGDGSSDSFLWGEDRWIWGSDLFKWK